MSALPSVRCHPENASCHAEFLTLAPIVERHAQIVFRHRNAADREEAVAEAVALAFVAFVRLKGRCQDPVRSFPSAIATFAALHVKHGRLAGSASSSTDALSPRAQQRRGFRVDPLPARRRATFQCRYDPGRGQQPDAWEERLQDNTLTPVPEQVAFRIDFPVFLRSLNERDRQTALALAQGHSATQVAEQFGLTGGRITQLRQRWKRAWLAFQGETESLSAAPARL